VRMGVCINLSARRTLRLAVRSPRDVAAQAGFLAREKCGSNPGRSRGNETLTSMTVGETLPA
jgi:hypothetical protein